MSFLNLTSDQLDTLSTLVERGLNDMNQHQKEGDLVQDGYSEGDIEAFHQTVEEGNKIQGLVGPAKVRAAALEQVRNSPIESSIVLAETILQAYSGLTEPVDMSSDADTVEKARCMVDLLADIMHYADKHDIDFGELAGRAHAHFCEETA